MTSRVSFVFYELREELATKQDETFQREMNRMSIKIICIIAVLLEEVLKVQKLYQLLESIS